MKEFNMAEEKYCPLLKENCIRERCKLWIQVTISGKNKDGKDISNTPPEQCAFVWVGVAALKEVQFSSLPAR
jgi:hypothetical protein